MELEMIIGLLTSGFLLGLLFGGFLGTCIGILLVVKEDEKE